ncbi:DNA-3-methyladenine glycosylase 2, partial [Enterobacter hormaechei]
MYTLNWQPPYDWSWMFGFLAARAVAGVETVTEDYYERSFGYAGHRGVFRVTPDSATPTLAVSLSPGLIPVADICLDRIARLFDLDCDPLHIARTLG